MYRYDEFDARIVKDRVEQFRGQVNRRLSGELLEDEFKPLRLHERRSTSSFTPTCCAWRSPTAS
jgi:hypothetical protein